MIAASLVGATIGVAIVSVWVLWPVIVELYWHGPDNHFCGRKGCCR